MSCNQTGMLASSICDYRKDSQAIPSEPLVLYYVGWSKGCDLAGQGFSLTDKSPVMSASGKIL